MKVWKCNILFLLLLEFCQVEGAWLKKSSEKKCACIYNQDGFSGYESIIKENVEISDLNTNFLTNGARMYEFGQGYSVAVEVGCRLKFCSDYHLRGDCKWILGNTSFTQLQKSKVMSVKCVCPGMDCETRNECGKIKLAPNECGRAFFEPNCQNCEDSYLTIRADIPNAGSEYWNAVPKVKSIFIKDGCSFTSGVAPNQVLLNSQFLTNWSGGAIAPYSCNCLPEVLKGPILPDKRTDDSPELINLDERDKRFKILENSRNCHPGVSAAIKSRGLGRSTNHAYILVLGVANSGKTTTLKLLFDNFPLKSIKSPSAIVEHRIPIQIDELGCKDCELRIIDTPGFGTDFDFEVNNQELIYNDAKFLAGLETFLQQHDDLSDRIPNVVLIYSKLTDYRTGKTSPFVKILRGIDTFYKPPFDRKNSNVIMILTHFLSENSTIQRNPRSRISAFRNLLLDYTRLRRPFRFAIAENKAIERNLPVLNGYFELPNKELFPLNILQHILSVVGVERDPIGYSIIKKVLELENIPKITEDIFWIGNISFGSERKFKTSLHSDFNINSTDVSKSLQDAYENVTEELKEKYVSTDLEYFQRTFNLQNIFNPKDVPRQTCEIVRIFQNLELNPIVEDVLRQAVQLEMPVFKSKYSSPLIGQSFNILENRVLQRSPLEKDEISQGSVIGYKFPKYIDVSLMDEFNDVFHWYGTLDEYFHDRLKRMGFEGTVKEKLRGELLPGFNYCDEGHHEFMMVSSLREFHLFNLSLKIQHLNISRRYLETLDALPAFSNSNEDIVNNWKNFFTKYGTHVVSSACGGGAIEGKCRINDVGCNSTKNFSEFLIQLSQMSRFDECSEKNRKAISPYSIVFHGGVDDGQGFTPDFSRRISDTTNNDVFLDKFHESIECLPKMLESTIKITPIVDLFETGAIPEDQKEKLRVGVAAYLNGEMHYTTPSSHEMIVLIVLVILILAVIVFIAFWYPFYKRNTAAIMSDEEIKKFLMGTTPSLTEETHIGNTGEINVESMPYERRYELPSHRMKIDTACILGSGQSGIVYKGSVQINGILIDAAFKTTKLSTSSAEINKLLAELKLMIHIGEHPNIVRIIGAYTKELKDGIVYIAAEFCQKGSLENLLRKCIFVSDDHQKKNVGLNSESTSGKQDVYLCQLEEWSLQIARGMHHLSKKSIIHSDLSARNILVADDFSIRITDFGLSRHLYDYTNYVKQSQEPLPWRWMAYESLTSLNFSSCSDVWSYGVTLFEIFTLGMTPYPGLSYDINFPIRLKQGFQLPCPEYATQATYQKMLECLALDPQKRPTFQELEFFFQNKNQQNTNL